MELEGFGASLIGRAIYVHADVQNAWIPWEFILGTTYSCRMLIGSEHGGVNRIEIENPWSFVIKPKSGKDWSCIATILRAMSGSVLLTFDIGCPRPSDSFVQFLDALVAEGKIVLTRIWLGMDVDIPTIPDAIFFPVDIVTTCSDIYDMLVRLPGRGGHDPWKKMSASEWKALTDTTMQSKLGIVLSDIGETEWTLFWHKLSDSDVLPRNVLFQKGFHLMRTAMSIMEHHAE